MAKRVFSGFFQQIGLQHLGHPQPQRNLGKHSSPTFAALGGWGVDCHLPSGVWPALGAAGAWHPGGRRGASRHAQGRRVFGGGVQGTDGGPRHRAEADHSLDPGAQRCAAQGGDLVTWWLSAIRFLCFLA